MKKQMDMTSGNLLKKIILFSVPIILSSMLQHLYTAVDLAVVGKFCGKESLAAVGSTNGLTGLITNLFIGISVGVNVLVARSVGRKDYEKVEKIVHTAVLFSFFAGILLMIFGISTARFWLELMETTAESIDGATIYLQIYFSGMIFSMMYNYGAAILRAIGETKKPLYILSASGIINVILNLIFVIFFKLDVVGVALATVISQAVSCIRILLYLMKTDSVVQLNLKKLQMNFKIVGEMVWIGLPAGIQSSLFSISHVVMQSAVNSFNSSIVVAGNTAASNIESFVYASMNAYSQASTTFTSQNYGARNLKNCKKSLIYSLICVFVSGAVFGLIALTFARPLLSIYNTDVEVIAVGIKRMTVICLTYYLCGMMDVFVGGMRGLGYSVVPMVFSLLGAVGFRIIWVATVFQANHTLETLYLAYPLSWIVTIVAHLTCYLIIYHIVKRKFLQEGTIKDV